MSWRRIGAMMVVLLEVERQDQVADVCAAHLRFGMANRVIPGMKHGNENGSSASPLFDKPDPSR